MKIFDASNSTGRPNHRGYGGPLENEVVAYLKHYATDYSCEFISDPNKADIIFTNDIYPDALINLGIPMVKRMDGVFFQNSLQDRNTEYNKAAQFSDAVIFISNFSKLSYLNSVETPFKKVWVSGNTFVVLNAVDPKIYYNKTTTFSKIEKWVAIATDWDRAEKRFQDLKTFAEITGIELYLIGTCNKSLPKNMVSLNYLTKYPNILRDMDAMVNFSYRDAAPKTVCQGIAVGLPVLYADSGGVGEIVGAQGLGIFDPVKDLIEVEIPDLDMEIVIQKYQQFLDTFSGKVFEPYTQFEKMLNGYFQVFKSF